ncbi:carboxylesterase/lipase family protein [Nocardia camponoti]|uniref:Carboxylic ester hydrolase n=1 Tax=Nocardia camponoti TaxID=1616106 RepID=A0A917V3L8_9NOCA|nr:carboxylesterase/lipase family protein [Nocardia camponoti]GGK32440.1 carboxylic ester hydrolase [Nocardia camponoti]
MSDTEVAIADGVVRGRAGKHVRTWRSLPYAAPPLGALRLRAPQPVLPWTGVRRATEFGFAATQTPAGARTGPGRPQRVGEDCLTLNVTAPLAAGSSRPVLVFFHGGGYLLGTSSMYSGARLVTRGDVIVVSVNYRLGGLGYVDFREFGTASRPFDANLGLRDQVAALEWVQRNIAAFGGDPANVTIFGESAGAHAVVTLLATPAARGLFHRAIAQSAPADWALTSEQSAAFARRVVTRLGVDPNDRAAAERVLATAPPAAIGRAADRALGATMRDDPAFFPYAPVVDGDFLPEAPRDAIAAGRAARVPLIIGTNRHEMTLFERFAKGVPHTPEQVRKLLSPYGTGIEPLLAAYPGFPSQRAAVRVSGDHLFWRPTIEVLDAHSAYAPTYAYRFDYASRALRLAGLGATHALDLLPVFGWVDGLVGRAITSAGGRRGFRSVQDQFQDNWLAFARTGAPLSDWPAYTSERRLTRIIDNPPRVIADPNAARRAAWQGLRGA